MHVNIFHLFYNSETVRATKCPLKLQLFILLYVGNLTNNQNYSEVGVIIFFIKEKEAKALRG